MLNLRWVCAVCALAIACGTSPSGDDGVDASVDLIDASTIDADTRLDAKPDAAPSSLAVTMLRATFFPDPYRVELGPWPYVYAAGLSLTVVGLTVCLTAFQPATRDPVIALRHE